MERHEVQGQERKLKGQHTRQRFICVIVTVLLMMPLLSIGSAQPRPAAAQQVPSGSVIVVLDENFIPEPLRQFLSTLPISLSFSNIFTGFVLHVTPEEATLLAQFESIAAIFPNFTYRLSTTDATGVRRIGSPSASQTGTPAPTLATAAVIDSGVQFDHPNLNVVGGFDAWGAYSSGAGIQCGGLSSSQAAQYESNPHGTWGSSANNQHGTHVAGTIGARGLDNIVGVAPGASIVGVRVFNESGSGATTASVICGIDWVIANKGRFGGIDAINLSIQGPAIAGGCDSDALHVAVCAAYNAGIPVVVSAGNAGGDNPTLGVYSEAIAVSAFNDYDGLPGGVGTRPSGCANVQPQPADDLFAAYSLSAGADIMAPGTCILSTVPGGGHAYLSGTSMAAAHATGALMLLAEGSPSASPSQALGYLLSKSVPQTDSDGLVSSGVSNGEPVLHLGDIPNPDPGTDPDPNPSSFTVTAAGQSSGAAPAAVVLDRDQSTIWTSVSGAPPSAFFSLDLGAVHAIGRVRWVFGSGNGGLADAWQIQLSNDNENWVLIKNRGNAAPGDWKDQVVNRNARYIRFSFTNPSGDNRLGGIAEVEVLPAEGPTTDLPEPAPTPTPSPSPAPGEGDPFPITNAGRSNGSTHPSTAYDVSMSTVWVTTTSSTPSSAYIYFSLGARKPIGTIRYVFGSGYGGLADSWEIQVSNDRTNWTTIARRGNASPRSWKEQAVNMEATFVRFVFSNPNADTQLGGIAEVQILPASGSVTPLPDATITPTATPTATASATVTVTPTDAYAFSMASRSSASTHPSLVYDGDPATEWITYSSAVPSSAFIYVSLGGVQPIGEIRWVFASTGSADSYEIQLSDDRSNWTTIATRSNAPVGEWQSLTVDQDAHYVRFLFNNPNGTRKLGGIGELQIYPPASVSPAENSTENPVEAATETATATATVTETVTPDETATEPPASPTETATATEPPAETPAETVTEEPAPTETATEPVIEETATEEATTEIAAEAPMDEPAMPWTPGPGIWPAGWSSSGQSQDGYVALDGEALTDWRTYPGTALPEAELGFDLGRVTWVTELWWLVAADPPGGRFVVEISLDGETWQVVGDWLTLGEPGAWVSLPVGAEARFVRIRFINELSQDQLGGIAEVVILP